MLCPKCGIAVDQSGTEWVQLFIDHPFRWSPVCHRDCAVDIQKDFPRLREKQAETKSKPRRNVMVGKKRVKK